MCKPRPGTPESELDLEQRVAQLAVGVIGLNGALRDVGRALHDDVDGLRKEINVQRQLTKYARRTWFEVMAWIFLAGLLLSDLGRRYCTPGVDVPEGVLAACDTVFWTSGHGAHWGWRLLGVGLTIMFLAWLARRSQVPPELYSRVPASAGQPEGQLSWYYRWLHRGRRS